MIRRITNVFCLGQVMWIGLSASIVVSATLWSSRAQQPSPTLESSIAPEIRRHLDIEMVRFQNELADPAAQNQARAYGRLARVYHSYGYLDQALAAYAKADALLPNIYPRLYLMGLVQSKLGDLSTAEQSFSKALALFKTTKESRPMIQSALESRAGEIDSDLTKTGEFG